MNKFFFFSLFTFFAISNSGCNSKNNADLKSESILDSYLLYVCESPIAKDGDSISSFTTELCINNCKKTTKSFQFKINNDFLSIYRIGTDGSSETSLRSGCDFSDDNNWYCPIVSIFDNTSKISSYRNNDGHISYSDVIAGKMQTSCFIKQ